MNWIKDNWLLIVVVLGVLVQIANAVTRHWSEHGGVKRWAAFIAEMLSIVTSAGTRVQGTPGKLKLPLQSVPPEPLELQVKRKRKSVEVLTIFGLGIVTIGGFGCAGLTWDQKAHKGIAVVFELAGTTHTVGVEAIQADCMKKAKACRAKGDRGCKSAEDCLAKRRKFDAAVKTAIRACKLASDSVTAIAATLKEFGVSP